MTSYRGIAQSGSAPALGAGCREFESLYPDQFYGLSVAPVAQLDRATAFELLPSSIKFLKEEIGSLRWEQNCRSGGHCIGETLTRHGDGNTEETAKQRQMQSVMRDP